MAHILIVDDDELIAEMASDILIAQGHACGWITSGEDALEFLRWRRPDLILLDSDMPGMTGPQTLRRIRGSARDYDLPVIMFTGITGFQDEQAALYAGAQEYVRKPFTPDRLLYKVNTVLAARASRPRHRSLDDALGLTSPRRRLPDERPIA